MRLSFPAAARSLLPHYALPSFPCLIARLPAPTGGQGFFTCWAQCTQFVCTEAFLYQMSVMKPHERKPPLQLWSWSLAPFQAA